MAHQHWAAWLKIAFIPLAFFTTTVADFTTECQRPCDCRWQSGNKAAICSNSSLKTIPGNLSSDIQILDLSNNNLLQLQQEAFKKVGLSNLKKLFLKECYIEAIHKAAFLTLAIMIELDLSKNRIRYLHPDTFKGTEKLRLINLSNNFIDKLEDGLFRNLKFLQKVEVSNNRILRIGSKTFVNLPQLKILRFDGNNLNHMKPETLMGLRNLSGLDLHNNPWRCDCNLQTFRDWVITHNLYTPPTSCAEPAIVKGKLWSELDSTNFACRPTILEPAPDATVRSYDENITLTCKVVGNPTPDVTWRYNGKTIETRAFGELRYVMTENTIDMIRWMNLTVINARYSDRGNYTCVAENPGGKDEKSLMLILSKYGNVGTIAGLDTDTFAILIGCLIAIIIIIGAVFAVCHFTAENNDIKRLIKNNTRSSNGEELIESIASESEKDKINKDKPEINPVMKPPRKYEPAPSITSEATEMSELNRTLLDSDPILAPNEEKYSLQKAELPKISRETLLIDRLTQEHQAYPPDLLSFPLRGQSSPVSSERQHQDSPKSPGYGIQSLNQLQNRYSSNYQSIPFINPKGGYVTLPRKPRSHQQETRPQVFSTLNGVMPSEFNMKLFNYGAYASLNRSEIELGPMRSQNFEDAEEFEPAPSPAPGTPHATIPRNSMSSPNIHNQLLSLQAMSMNAARGRILKPSEQRPLKVMLTDDGIRSRDRLGYSVNVVSGINLRTIPKPPPKPRKRSSCDLKETFLSSNDNATQV